MPTTWSDIREIVRPERFCGIATLGDLNGLKDLGG